ncbi:MAG: hypothetical protein ABEJ76_05130 [Halanaeroarchaeum sp.]
MVWIIDNIVQAIGLFGQVATNDPVAPLLLLGAASIFVVAFAVFGVLAVGGVLAALAQD